MAAPPKGERGHRDFKKFLARFFPRSDISFQSPDSFAIKCFRANGSNNSRPRFFYFVSKFSRFCAINPWVCQSVDAPFLMIDRTLAKLRYAFRLNSKSSTIMGPMVGGEMFLGSFCNQRETKEVL